MSTTAYHTFVNYCNNLNLTVSLWLVNVVDYPQYADCLVNSTGNRFECSGGISRAIKKACGSASLQNDFNNYLSINDQLEFGKVFRTSPYSLHRFTSLLHVASPHGRMADHARLLHKTHMSIFEHASASKYKSIVVPFIGTGLNSIDILTCCKCIHESIEEYFKTTPTTLVHLSFITIDKEHIHKAKQFFDNNHANSTPVAQASALLASTTNKDDEDDNCVICMDKLDKDKTRLDKCGHVFCSHCINEYFQKSKKQCPCCGTLYGIIIGDQPLNAQMDFRVLQKQSLPGHEPHAIIQITYTIPNGIQTNEHPSPGQPYTGTTRVAYLPDSDQGRQVLELLRKAFANRLIFTIGRSRTTGANNVCTWNDIHHKTSIYGGSSQFGYPDPSYLSRVKQELASKGIV